MNKRNITLFTLITLIAFGSTLQAQEFTLEDFHNSSIRPQAKNIHRFSPDGERMLKSGFYKDSLSGGDGIQWYVTEILPERDFQRGDTLFHSRWFEKDIPMGSWEFSKNMEFLLVKSNRQAIYRHSASYMAHVVYLNDKKCIDIPGRLRYPTLSPNNENLAYVRDNNLYVYNLAKGLEKSITKDGKFNEIINGAVDWVYEEEFSMSQGFEWSPSGRYIAYYKFDERKVKEFSMDEFHELYPNQVKWKYPKAGEDNSRVDVFVYDVEKKSNRQLPLESQEDQYIPRFQWMQTDKHLSIQRLNRLQNQWEVLIWNSKTDHMEVIIEEGAETYIDINDKFTLIPNSTKFLYLSTLTGYNHIYTCDYTNKTNEPLTSGEWQVNSIDGFNPKNGYLYYRSTEGSTVEDHLYMIKLNGKKKSSVLGYKAGTGDQYIIASEGAKWIYAIVSNHSENPTYRVCLLGNRYFKTWDDTAFYNAYKAKNPGKITFGEIPLDSSNFTLNYWMLKPNNMDPDKTYPLLMYCYGGPGNSICRNRYNRYGQWFQYLASKGYVVVCVDNRGTGNKGSEFQKCTYKQLGKIEQEDQRFAAEYFGRLPFIDKSRIGIWGWSFGGYLTSLCMTKSPDIFKMGIAVAPVTHWKYYDNIYTERYLQRPQDNPSGYDDNSPINFAKNIKGKYLIVHGTGDDNVHFQNTAEMINAMIKENVKFDSEIYPNRAHGISDRAARRHLFDRLTKFVLENL